MEDSKAGSELKQETGASWASVLGAVIAVLILGAIATALIMSFSGQGAAVNSLPIVFGTGILTLLFVLKSYSESSSGDSCDGGLESGCDYDSYDAGTAYY
jgi:hypothetical protein